MNDELFKKIVLVLIDVINDLNSAMKKQVLINQSLIKRIEKLEKE